MTIQEFHRDHVSPSPRDELDEALRRLTAAKDIDELRSVQTAGWAEWPNNARPEEA